MDFAAGGRALPGVQISIGSGRSGQELADLTRQVKALADAFNRVQANANHAGRAVDTTLRAAGRTATASAGAQRQATATRAPLSQTDRDYAELVARRRAAQRQQALSDAYAPAMPPGAAKPPRPPRPEPTEQERQYRAIMERDRQKHMEEVIQRGSGRDTGMLARGMNALSWAPGIPPELYMAQMAMGETGLGLGTGLVAGGLGIGALAFGGLAMQSAMVGQQKTGEQVAATIGTASAFTTGAQDTALLQGKEWDAGLKGGQGQEIAAGLAAGGLPRADALGAGFDRVTNLVNAFGMSIQDATNFVVTERTTLGYSDQQLIAQQRDLAITAAALNVPLANLGTVLGHVQNLPANLPVAAQGPMTATFLAAGGTAQAGTDLGNIVNARGAGALALGAMTGHTNEQITALQGTQAGQEQLLQEVLARARLTMSQGGRDQGMMVFNALAAQTGVQVTPEEYQRIASPAPVAAIAAQRTAQQQAATAIAHQEAANALFDQKRFGPGGEDQYAAIVAAGGTVKPGHAVQEGPGRAFQILGTTVGNWLQQFEGNPQAQAALAGGGAQGMAARGIAGLPPADQAIASGTPPEAPGQPGQRGDIRVSGAAQLVVRIENQAGRVLGIQTISIPLANGDQSTRAYVPGTPGPR